METLEALGVAPGRLWGNARMAGNVLQSLGSSDVILLSRSAETYFVIQSKPNASWREQAETGCSDRTWDMICLVCRVQRPRNAVNGSPFDSMSVREM